MNIPIGFNGYFLSEKAARKFKKGSINDWKMLIAKGFIINKGKPGLEKCDADRRNIPVTEDDLFDASFRSDRVGC